MIDTNSQHEPERDPGERPAPAVALFDAWHRLIAALFRAWHRALVRIASGVVRVWRAIQKLWRVWAAQWTSVRDYHATADRPWVAEGERDRQVAAAVGLRAFVAGMLLAAVAAASAPSSWPAGAVTAMAEVLWAAARFIIIALLMPSAAIDRRRLSIVYVAGLVPYLFGTTALLRLISLGASAYLTRRGLLGAGVAQPDANRATGWAFGGQFAAYSAGWLLRAAVALVALF